MDTDRSVELSLTLRCCALLCVAAVLKVNCMRLKVVKVRFALLTSGSSSKRSIALLASRSNSIGVLLCFALFCIAWLCFSLLALLCFALLTSPGKSNKSTKSSSRRCRHVIN